MIIPSFQLGEASEWALLQSPPFEGRPPGEMKSATPKRMAKPTNQPEGVEEAYASCIDGNGRLQVSTWARDDVMRLQQQSQGEHLLDHPNGWRQSTRRVGNMVTLRGAVGAAEETRKDWW